MAYPSFSVAGGATVTLTRGRIYPCETQVAINQIHQEAEDGTVTTVELGPDITYLQAQFVNVPAAEKTDLLAFFQSALVRWGLYTFTFTDEDSTAYTVRYWGPYPWSCTERSSGLYDIAFLLRVED